MRLTESQKILKYIKESVDVVDFYVSNNSPYMKVVCDIAKCNSEDIKECIGYVFNDDEPEDFILEMNDDTGKLININRNSAESFNSKQDAIEKLFGDGANYNF